MTDEKIPWVHMPKKIFPPHTEPYMRYVCRVAYDGTQFHGFQFQREGKKTICGAISTAFQQIFQIRLKPVGASRTDSGVHARGQVIHFDIPERIAIKDLRKFEISMNAVLPQTVQVYDTIPAPLGTPEQIAINETFHSCKSALKKKYVYRFCLTRHLDPLLRNFVYQRKQPMDVDLFHQALQIFPGTHNFRAFGSTLDRVAEEMSQYNLEFTPVRTVQSVHLLEEPGLPGYFRVEMELESAIYRMVRNIVGTCFEVGAGKISMDELRSLLHEGKHRKANPAIPAKPHGLCLERVYYDHY